MEINSLQLYIKELNAALKAVGTDETNAQFKKLISLEGKFVRRLRALPDSKNIHMKFVNLFADGKEKDIREARPYFRERLNVYKTVINPAIERRNYKALYKVRLNFLFCSFAIKNITKPDKELFRIFDQIKELRETLIHKHLHHAISHAKRFKLGLGNIVDFNDLIQLANEALISAVDKYVIDENSSEFHNMAMGWILAFLIESGDQTLPVTVGPTAFRLLYRIRKLLSKTPGISARQISEITNTLESDIAELLNLSRTISLDESLNKDDGPGDSPSITLQDFLPSPVSMRSDPYTAIENRDLMQVMLEMFKNLTLLQQKALRLKGIKFENYI